MFLVRGVFVCSTGYCASFGALCLLYSCLLCWCLCLFVITFVLLFLVVSYYCFVFLFSCLRPLLLLSVVDLGRCCRLFLFTVGGSSFVVAESL